MPTAILELDLEHIPDEVTGVERYGHALILIRYKGRPVGKVQVPIACGKISNADLREPLVKASLDTLWKEWLYDSLSWKDPCDAGFPPPQATVAVCTRDRPEDMRRCLDALIRMPDDGQEYLVIDNCPSTEATRTLVGHYERVRYVREDYPGESAARNRALREAKYDIVAFTDDDAVPDPGWLRALVRNFDDPRVLCVTGLVMPFELEFEAQEWFEKYSGFGRGFSRKVLDGANCNRFAVASAGASVSMALHRKVLACVSAFDEALGVGTRTRSGCDHELFFRILARGYKIVYEPEALSWHRHRRTWEETRKTFYAYGVGVYAFWTRSLLVEKEFGVFRVGWAWFYGSQFPNLIRSLLRRPGSVPLNLLLAELKGCLVGPWAYLLSRQKTRTRQ